MIISDDYTNMTDELSEQFWKEYSPGFGDISFYVVATERAYKVVVGISKAFEQYFSINGIKKRLFEITNKGPIQIR